MKTYKVSFEIVLKDYPSLEKDDFIERAILEQLEDAEFINEYTTEEITK